MQFFNYFTFTILRLRLADILVRPMQRLTKYSLLLSAIKKHIVDENDAEIMDAMVNNKYIMFSIIIGICAFCHIFEIPF